MKTNFLSVLAAALFSVSAMAQETEPVAPAPDSTNSKTSESGNSSGFHPVWTVGLSGTVIDDDGSTFSNLFNVSDSWNFLPYPTRVHVDMQLNPLWSFEAAFTYSQLQEGKTVNDVVMDKDYLFIAFDVNARIHMMKETKIFDPYGMAGLGMTFRENFQYQTPTLNVGLGANIWFIPSFGLNIQTSGKLAMVSNSSSYMQHSIGLLYRFGQENKW